MGGEGSRRGDAAGGASQPDLQILQDIFLQTVKDRRLGIEKGRKVLVRFKSASSRNLGGRKRLRPGNGRKEMGLVAAGRGWEWATGRSIRSCTHWGCVLKSVMLDTEATGL